MRNSIIINKLILYVDKIMTYCENMEYEDFAGNTQLAEACVFNLSQMGELVNRLDDEYTERHPDVPWYEMRGLRNRIVHDYEGVNLLLVWDIIRQDLPELRDKLLSITRNLI